MAPAHIRNCKASLSPKTLNKALFLIDSRVPRRLMRFLAFLPALCLAAPLPNTNVYVKAVLHELNLLYSNQPKLATLPVLLVGNSRTVNQIQKRLDHKVINADTLQQVQPGRRYAAVFLDVDHLGSIPKNFFENLAPTTSLLFLLSPRSDSSLQEIRENVALIKRPVTKLTNTLTPPFTRWNLYWAMRKAGFNTITELPQAEPVLNTTTHVALIRAEQQTHSRL